MNAFAHNSWMGQVPTLYEWIGGTVSIERMLTVFYERVAKDALLAPVFAKMSSAHVKHVTAFIAEVFGGPTTYSEEFGGHHAMIARHADRALTETQRKRWVQLLLECADELGIKSDPEFRSALVSYLEWGSRLAVINSQPGADLGSPGPMPKWGWGEVEGPYIAPEK